MSKKVKWLLTIAALAACVVPFIPNQTWRAVLGAVAAIATVVGNSPLMTPFRYFS